MNQALHDVLRYDDNRRDEAGVIAKLLVEDSAKSPALTVQKRVGKVYHEVRSSDYFLGNRGLSSL
jgi:hypothetical protein